MSFPYLSANQPNMSGQQQQQQPQPQQQFAPNSYRNNPALDNIKMDHKQMNRRQRAPKTTQDQYEVFLDYAVKNYVIIDSKRDPMDNNEQLVQQKWDELTAILNTSGRGPQRTTKEWQTTFSNWKNSIRHKMKCIIDGTSRTMLTELEGRALQLWDIVAYNGLPRFSASMQNSSSQLIHDETQDDSTHSSSAFFGGGGQVKEEPQANTNDDTTYADEELDEDEDEDKPLPPVPQISHAMSVQTPTPNHYKRRKVDANQFSSSTPNAFIHTKQRNGGRRNGEELDGSILIAESISKLADNVGNMAESIRDIAAAFTTTTQAAFELIRKQSEIIQSLIQQQ